MQMLAELTDRYIATNQSVQSSRTIRSHRTNEALFSDYLGRPAKVSDLTDETVGGYWRVRGGQVGRNTLNGEASTLLALWRWAALRALVAPPTIRAPSRTRRTPQALTREQVVALWTTAAKTPQMVGDLPGKVYWPALLYVLWQTGERIGAVRRLEWDSIDLDRGWIIYPASTRKFGQEELARPITQTATKALRSLRRVSPDAPFDAVPSTAWYALWHALRAEAGLPSWVTPHSIRKSVASHLPSLDDACEMLGHSSSATTRANYRDPRVAGGPQLVDKLFDPMEGQPRRRWLGWFAG